MSKKKSFVLYKDFHPQLEMMSPEQAGHLIKAIFAHQNNLPYSVDDQIVCFALKGIVSQFIRDDAKYDAICIKRSSAGVKGAKQKLAKAGKRKQKIASAADRDRDSDSDSDREKEKHSKEVAEVLSFYNEIRGAMPKMLKLSAIREGQILARIDEVGFDALKITISDACCSKFLQGDNARRWVADLEWITKSANFTKIMEGKYINREKINDSSDHGFGD